jgi:predicted RNA binding protein YcfA (HicA-like mRNA interferase family)
MKLPRDLSCMELVKALKTLGYEVSRQTGSHMRLTTIATGNEHHLTIPRHNPLRVGTLAAILDSVASNFGLTREEIIKRIFPK